MGASCCRLTTLTESLVMHHQHVMVRVQHAGEPAQGRVQGHLHTVGYNYNHRVTQQVTVTIQNYSKFYQSFSHLFTSTFIFLFCIFYVQRLRAFKFMIFSTI